MTLCTFLRLIYNLVIVLTFLGVWHIRLHHGSWLQIFQFFQFSFFQVKIINHLKRHAVSSILNIIFKKMFFMTIFILVFATHLKLSTGNYCDVAHPKKIFMYKYLRYDFLLHILMNILTYFSSYSSLYINNISISVNRSSFTLIFFKALAMLILVQNENEQDQAYIN